MVFQQVVSRPVPSIRRLVPAFLSDLELICYKCLEKEPHNQLRLLFLARRGPAAIPRRQAGRRSTAWPGVAGVASRATQPGGGRADDGCRAHVHRRRLVSWVKAGRGQTERDRGERLGGESEGRGGQSEGGRGRDRFGDRATQTRRGGAKSCRCFSLRTVRVALYSRELGDAQRAVAVGDILTAETRAGGLRARPAWVGVAVAEPLARPTSRDAPGPPRSVDPGENRSFAERPVGGRWRRGPPPTRSTNVRCQCCLGVES